MRVGVALLLSALVAVADATRYYGMYFTDAEETQALDIVNQASVTTLRFQYRLNTRLAHAVFDRRPYKSLNSLQKIGDYDDVNHVLRHVRSRLRVAPCAPVATGDKLTVEQQQAVVNSLNDICGDTFCGGDYSYDIVNLRCPVSDANCYMRVQARHYDEGSPTLTYNCVLRGKDGFAGAEELINQQFTRVRYSEELYDSVLDDCVGPIETGELAHVGDKLTVEQSMQVVNSLNDICGDTFCGGDYSYDITKLICPLETSSCYLDLEATSYDEGSPTLAYRCELRGDNGFTDAGELVNTQFANARYSEELYNSVLDDCVGPIETGLLLPVPDRLSAAERDAVLQSLTASAIDEPLRESAQDGNQLEFKHIGCAQSVSFCRVQVLDVKTGATVRLTVFVAERSGLFNAAQNRYGDELYRALESRGIPAVLSQRSRPAVPSPFDITTAQEQQQLQALQAACDAANSQLCTPRSFARFDRLLCSWGGCTVDFTARNQRYLCALKSVRSSAMVLDTPRLIAEVRRDCTMLVEEGRVWPQRSVGGPSSAGATTTPAAVTEADVLRVANEAAYEVLQSIDLSNNDAKRVLRYRPWCKLADLESRIGKEDADKLRVLVQQ